MSYYSAIMVLTWMTLAALCILVQENNRIDRDRKRFLYLTCLLIGTSALAEWFGIKLNGNPDYPEGLLLTVKCFDYMLTPVAGGLLVMQMNTPDAIRQILKGLLGFNILFQLVATTLRLNIDVDENHFYHHGQFYNVYVMVYLIVIAMLIFAMISHGKSYRKENRGSLYFIMVVVLAGIMMQEGIGGHVRTAYIGLAIGLCLIFIHNEEFQKIEMDDHIQEQQLQIDVDPLTGCFSRYAYSNMLKEYADSGAVPEDLAVVAIDINELKRVNDTLGHEAGDELICGAADCISGVIGRCGKCFRTGGDEFVVIAELDSADCDGEGLHDRKSKSEEMKRRIMIEAAKWSGEKVKELSLSLGFVLACDHPDVSAEELVRLADLAMYEAKKEFYMKSGKDRRR